MENSIDISTLEARLISELLIDYPDLLVRFPIWKYLNYLDCYPEIGDYLYLSRDVSNYCKAIVEYSDERTLEIYQKLVLVTLISRARRQLASKVSPGEIKELYESNFRRIIREIETNMNPSGFYRYPEDKFFKELGVCNLRMIPTGARKIHLGGLARRFLFKKGPKQFFQGIIFIVFELKGTKPLYEMHTDSHDPDLMADFNYEGFTRAYMRIAQLLKLNENVRGVFASSWFYDPQLAVISPRLAYLREIITNNGGRCFYWGASGQATKDAILKSPTRSQLYKEGRYRPIKYMVVWSREKMLRWADKHLCDTGSSESD